VFYSTGPVSNTPTSLSAKSATKKPFCDVHTRRRPARPTVTSTLPCSSWTSSPTGSSWPSSLPIKSPQFSEKVQQLP